MRIAKLGVVGAGTMGSGIAALAASAGIPVVLLDIPGPDGDRNAPARAGLERARKARPAAFMDPARAGLITLGNLDDSLELLANCDLVLEENSKRGPTERPLFVMYDQVYWMITAGGAKHVDPITLRPAIAPYVIFVDAISKAFAATGLRVGWAVAPSDVIRPMNDVVGHVGAWAPRAEQVATAKFLVDHEGNVIRRYGPGDTPDSIRIDVAELLASEVQGRADGS